MSNSFLSFDVFVFNRMRHNGLLLLVCCWFAPGLCQVEKVVFQIIPIQ